MEDRRTNDILILSEIKSMREDVTDIKKDVCKINDTIHGNSHDGLKTSQGKLKIQVKYMWVIVSAACIAILNDYIRRG